MSKLNIGLSIEQRQGVIDLLNGDLSDAYLLLIKTKKIPLGCRGTAVPVTAYSLGRTL